jgi:hypothetical protein
MPFVELGCFAVDMRPEKEKPLFRIEAAPRNPSLFDEGLTFSIMVRASDAHEAQRRVQRYCHKLKITGIQ